MPDYEKSNPKPELVIALAGPVGTDLDGVATLLEEELSPYHYKTYHVKVSSLITEWCEPAVKLKIEQADADERIHMLMNAGDAIRAGKKKGQALLPLILAHIGALRSGILISRDIKEDGIEAYNSCFIINSLKHPDEVKVLREIYGPKLILISAFASVESRTSRLCELIAKSKHTTDNGQFFKEAEDLIKKDSQRANTEIGQNLRHTFPLADFFVSTDKDFKNDVERFLESIFSNPFKTPRTDEYFMYEAAAAALRSADLSRQVGAAIVDEKRGLLTKGCNEVPAYGGNAYWADDPDDKDYRDYKKGQDYNAVKKVEILEELFKFLLKRQIISSSKKSDEVLIVDQLVFGDEADFFKNLRVSNLIEFGRMIHAEMTALMDAARRGISVEGGTLYSTAFPCHMCARHIIAAGLRRVVYVEPYPKSMAQELYDDMIIVDGLPADRSIGDQTIAKVRFEPFVGIAPRIYPKLFAHIKRKDERGHVIPWVKAKAQPRIAVLATAHLNVELALSKDVATIANVSLEDLDAIKGTRAWLDSAS